MCMSCGESVLPLERHTQSAEALHPPGDAGGCNSGGGAVSPAPDSRRTRSAAAAAAAAAGQQHPDQRPVTATGSPAPRGSLSGARRGASNGGSGRGVSNGTAPHGATANGLISSGSSAPDDGKAVTSPATAGALRV